MPSNDIVCATILAYPKILMLTCRTRMSRRDDFLFNLFVLDATA